MNHYIQTLSQDQGTDLSAVGTTIHVVSSSGEFELIIGSETISVNKGTTYKTDQFNKVRIVNKYAGTNEIDLLIGAGDYIPPMKLVGDVSANVIVATTSTTYEDVAVTDPSAQVLASNANRKEVILQNIGANPLRIGDSNVSNTRGIQISPNSSFILTSTASVYAYSASGSTLSIMEVA